MNSKLKQKPMMVELDSGTGKKVHPLVYVRQRCDMKEVAKALGHTNHTTFSIYASKAARSKTLPIPAEWVLPLARITGLKPAVFRPDLYLPTWLLTS